MYMQLVNIKEHKIEKCAFCRNWYDPMNAAIRPRSAEAGFWEYDPLMKAQCQVRNAETTGTYGCSRFVSKL